MPTCAILVCKNKSSSQNLSRGGISYHRFPSNPNVKAKWIVATGRQNWYPGRTSTICSLHFEVHDFVIKNGFRHYLHPAAVPSWNILSEQKIIETSHEINSSEPERTNASETSIEVEVMPENNSVNVSPEMNDLQDATIESTYPRTHEEDKKLIALMQARMQEQDLMIKKLKMRNCRLRKRLFSLKSMES